MKKTILTIITTVIVVLCGIFAYHKLYVKDTTIKLFGNVDIKQVNVAFRTGGRIENLLVEEGTKVKKGDLLAAIDEEPVFNKLNQAKAQQELARIKKEQADRYLGRNLELCKQQTISQQECDNILSQSEEANAYYNYMKAVADEAETAYNDTKLYAPEDGTILIKVQENGAMIGAGTPVYTLSLNNKTIAKVYVDGNNLGRIKIGERAQIYAQSLNKVYNGHIGFISPVAEFTPKNIETESLRTDLVYRLRVIVDDADDYLKQGMPITVLIK